MGKEELVNVLFRDIGFDMTVYTKCTLTEIFYSDLSLLPVPVRLLELAILNHAACLVYH